MSSKKRILNAIPDATLVGSVILAGLLDRIIPLRKIVPFPINYVGWVIAAAGILLIVRTMSLIRSRRASSDVSGESAVLITDGSSSFSRNPLYLAYVLITAGVAIALGSVTAFVGPVLCVMILDRIIIPYEEKQLAVSFGQTYEKYKHLTRRWI